MSGAAFVSYARVSTARQQASGLGLDAQRQAVAAYAARLEGIIVAEFVEAESGKRNDRPELLAALAACRMHGATLLIARLDRLSRDAAFLLSLRDSGVDFVAVDMPGANRLSIGVMAMVAEAEGEAISLRTKAALHVAKQRGVELGRAGRRNFNDVGRAKGRAAAGPMLTRRANERAQDRAVYVARLRAEGCATLADFARGLTRLGVLTARRKATWSEAQVARLLSRLDDTARRQPTG